MHSNIFSTVTLVCTVAYQVICSIAPSFADQPKVPPKVPPRCYMRYYNCITAYNPKNREIPEQCKTEYSYCLKGVTAR
jgi:hypothetical protein